MNIRSTITSNGSKGKRVAAILLTSALALGGLAAAPLSASAAPAGHSVTGSYSGPGTTADNLDVYVYNSSTELEVNGTTDSSGHFTLVGVPDGDYRLYADTGYDYYAPYADVDVAGADVTVDPITLIANHDFSGHISTADGKSFAAGDVSLSLYGPGNFSLYPDVDANGDWTVTVGDDSYSAAPEGDWTGYVYLNGYKNATITFTNTPDGVVVNTVLQLPAHINVTGTVSAPSDVAGLVATLYSYNDDSVVGTATTNANGAYSVAGALSGSDYYLKISDPQGAYATTTYAQTYTDDDGTQQSYSDIYTDGDTDITGINLKLATTAFAGTAASVAGSTGLGGILSVAVAANPAANYAFQWSRNGFAIPGAVGATYAVTAADQGTTLGVTVVLAKRGYTTATVGTTIAIPAASAPATTVLKTLTKVATPTVKGTVKVGKTLKVTVKASKPKATSVKYQWYANGKAIKKATKSSFKITKTLKGKTLSVKVSSSKKGYKTVIKTVKIKGKVKK